MKKSIFLLLTYFFYSSTAQCTLDFANRNVHLAMNDQTTTKVRLGKVASITGWGHDSIVDTYGNNASTSWTESYTNGVVLGTGRRKAPTNMVYNNSNAINASGPITTLIRQTSNALANNALTSIRQLVKNNSNSIVALNTLGLTKNNSNLNVLLNLKIRTDSNALLFGLKNNSNAITAPTLTTLIRTNSNVLASPALTQLVRTNSNAINSFTPTINLVRNNSKAINTYPTRFTNLVIQNSNAINSIGNTVQIVANHSRFQATTTINKLILYKAGISVDAGKTLTLMTPLPVSGNIALKSTGKLVLAGDLYLNSNAYITSGGYVAGNNFSLVMSDSLVLSTLTTLQITSSLIIDGNGGTLVFGPHAQLLLESNVSLTLKNVTIQTTRNSSNIPIIRCFDQKGHVTLDNVTLACADDFPFRTGRLFINNDVHFTGTSRFIYQSWMQSYVTPKSLLTFDPGTTLYYYPSSTNKDLIQLQDKSSGIYLNGSITTLQTTHTGMRLTKGRLWMDNKITLSTQANTMLDSVTQATTGNHGDTAPAIAWSPNRRFLALTYHVPPFANTYYLKIFKISETNTQTLVTSLALNGGSCLGWSPDGRYLAVGISDIFTNRSMDIYSFDGTSLTFLSTTVFSEASIYCLAWSPNGQYIAVGTGQSGIVYIYRFNGAAAPSLVDSVGYDATGLVLSVSWHPDSTKIIVAAFYGDAGG